MPAITVIAVKFSDIMRHQEVRDQTAHAVTVIAIGLPLAFYPGVWSGIWSGLCVGLLAEIKERGSTVTVATIKAAIGSWKDLLGYTLAGGGLVGMAAFMGQMPG